MSGKIYTKTGDNGHTSLIGGTKVPKSHLRIDCYGTVDELNSHIGLIADHLTLALQNDDERVPEALREIQDRLFTIGSSLATDPEKEPKMKLPDLLESDVQHLEAAIDSMTARLRPMRSFILPGGSVEVSAIHVSRCVCRRAERICVAMRESEMFVDDLVIRYLNRLSDYLFVLARYVMKVKGIDEIEWKPRISTRPR